MLSFKYNTGLLLSGRTTELVVAMAHKRNIMDAIGRLPMLLHNQEGTDFTITCGEREWRVHRLVLSMHSDVFSHACNGAFKEAQEGRLDLSEDGEECVNTLIDYVYHFDYKNDPSPSSAALDVKMAVMADRYNMPHLQELATAHFKKRFPLKLSDKQLPLGFAEAAREAYEVEGPTIPFRNAIVAGLRGLKLSEETLLSIADIHPGLTTDLLRDTHRRVFDLEKKLRNYKSYLCISSEEAFSAKVPRASQQYPCCSMCCSEGVPWGEALDEALLEVT